MNESDSYNMSKYDFYYLGFFKILFKNWSEYLDSFLLNGKEEITNHNQSFKECGYYTF